MWKKAATELIYELSDVRNELDADIAVLEHAIETNNEKLFLIVRDDVENR